MKKLSNKNMSEIQGGWVSKDEYCDTAWEIIANNTVSASAIAAVIGICD